MNSSSQLLRGISQGSFPVRWRTHGMPLALLQPFEHQEQLGSNSCVGSIRINSNSFFVTTSKALVTTSVALVTSILFAALVSNGFVWVGKRMSDVHGVECWVHVPSAGFKTMLCVPGDLHRPLYLIHTGAIAILDAVPEEGKEQKSTSACAKHEPHSWESKHSGRDLHNVHPPSRPRTNSMFPCAVCRVCCDFFMPLLWR